MKRYIIAHDLGTSGDKASLFDENGRTIDVALQSYTTNYFNSNWAEQDPNEWWLAVCDTTKKLIMNSGVSNNQIEAVCFSGHMMGCLCIDESGNPLRPHILWADSRSQTQANTLVSAFSEGEFYKITGHRCSASYSISKLMWVRDNEPDIYSKTYKMINAKDWLVYKLTGEVLTDYSDASGTNALNINTMNWSEEILQAADIPIDKMPSIVNSTEIVGKVTPEAARMTGLSQSTNVVMGGGDGLCATVGAGCVKEGIIHACLGTSSWVSYATEDLFFDKRLRTFNWAHVIPEMICPCGTMQSAGSSVSWLIEKILQDNTGNEVRSISNIINDLSRDIESAKAGSNGLLFLPYLLGERSPRWNPDAKGAFIGLKMEHSKSDMLQAVFEGVAMNLCVILDIFRENGYNPQEIVLIGGGARNDIWCQILADVFGINVVRLLQLEEATSIGAALMAGIGVNIFDGFNEIDKFISIDKTFKPRDEYVNRYNSLKNVFEKAYLNLAPVFDDLAELK